jgi:hypothetical protein
MRAKKTVTQSGNTIQGDQAAGDIYKSTKIINQKSSLKVNKIKELFEKFHYEKENNIQFCEIIEELEHYRTPKGGEKIIGVSDKLKAGKRDNFIEYALEVKEMYYKKLVRYQLYESAQKINVFLLAMVRNYFMNNVYPLILNNAGEVEVSQALNEYIINPLLEQLDGDTLGFTADDVNGMLYFLTGNCHLKWAS